MVNQDFQRLVLIGCHCEGFFDLIKRIVMRNDTGNRCHFVFQDGNHFADVIIRIGKGAFDLNLRTADQIRIE